MTVRTGPVLKEKIGGYNRDIPSSSDKRIITTVTWTNAIFSDQPDSSYEEAEMIAGKAACFFGFVCCAAGLTNAQVVEKLSATFAFPTVLTSAHGVAANQKAVSFFRMAGHSVQQGKITLEWNIAGAATEGTISILFDIRSTRQEGGAFRTERHNARLISKRPQPEFTSHRSLSVPTGRISNLPFTDKRRQPC